MGWCLAGFVRGLWIADASEDNHAPAATSSVGEARVRVLALRCLNNCARLTRATRCAVIHCVPQPYYDREDFLDLVRTGSRTRASGDRGRGLRGTRTRRLAGVPMPWSMGVVCFSPSAKSRRDLRNSGRPCGNGGELRSSSNVSPDRSSPSSGGQNESARGCSIA